MQHKLTLSVNEKFYKRLHKVVGRGNISRFIEDIAHPYLFAGVKLAENNNVKVVSSRKAGNRKEGVDDFIALCDRLAVQSKRNGMTEEILHSILHGKE